VPRVVSLPAHLVATPVLERLTAGLRGARSGGRAGEPEDLLHGGELEGVVLGMGATAAWVDLDGFVVAITTREVPLLPNAIALAAGSGALAGAGAGSGGIARLAPGRVALGSLQVTWDPAAPPSWDPTVPVPEGATLPAVEARGAALLRALGAEGAVDNHENQFSRSATLPHRGSEQPPGAEAHAPGRDPAEDLVRTLTRIGLATANDPDGVAGLTLLFRAVDERDPEPARVAVRHLLGRGPGLTPEGDDLLAAVAGTLAVLRPAIDPSAQPHEPPPPDRFRSTAPPEPPGDPLLAALRPVPGRTTGLSATLLALALDRRLPEPAGRLLDFSPLGEAAWPAALERLERLGHGSGRAYAAGITATACLVGSGDGMAVFVP
jgi:hypothetical protein